MKGLDKYLTTPPEDGYFDAFFEDVVESLDEEFFNDNELWIMDDPEGKFDSWVQKLFSKTEYAKMHYSSRWKEERKLEAARASYIIQRAFRIYKF